MALDGRARWPHDVRSLGTLSSRHKEKVKCSPSTNVLCPGFSDEMAVVNEIPAAIGYRDAMMQRKSASGDQNISASLLPSEERDRDRSFFFS